MKSLIGRSFDITVLNEQKKKRTRFVILAIACILVCAAIFYLGFRWFLNRQYESYQVERSIYVKNGNSMSYESYQDGIIRYGRDGVTAVDRKGNSIWSGSYDMANPKADTCGSSVVIADIGGESLYVYKGGGTGTEFTVDFPIVQACISNQGVVAVLVEDSSSNTIALYNPFDKAEALLAEIPTNVEDGYPVALDLSPDGSSVVASYLNVTTGAAQSHVAFYNFTEVGKNANCLVGAHNYKETLISEVQFMGSSDVCLFSEKGFYLWTNMRQPEAVAEKEFEETIQSAFIDEGHVGVLLKKDDLKCNMKLYDTDGNNTLSIDVDAAFTHVQISGDEILFHSAEWCAVYRINGIRKFSKDLTSKISYFFPSDKKNYYFFVQDSKIKIIKLK
ncbi:hypothetical protein D7V86_10740 [bacterium D16-51]|nr:hypothetical protein D7V96_11505 [bacterium D16-59]RKI59973.1 hypothetical protein D7V86_10740 [bacterium D16-51]